MYALEFGPETFDVTYCHALFEWLGEPVRALAELKRVTRRGGWVIAGLVAWCSEVVYPPCPALESVRVAYSQLNDPADLETFLNMSRGQEAMALFSQAGFDEITIEGYFPPRACGYSGSMYFDDQFDAHRVLLDLKGTFGPWLKKLIDLGALDEKTILAAQKEIETWSSHPHALKMTTWVLAGGKVG